MTSKDRQEEHMAKSEKQKLKLLYIRDLLLEKTDCDHAITTNEIIQELAKEDIAAERKSIYQDIQLLNDYVMEVGRKTSKPQGYFVEDRDFELAEVKLLVDLVEAAKFVTDTKSRALIKKLERLTSVHHGKKLQRQVLVTDRIKTANESIYYNVDCIHEAISQNKKISFLYYRWTVQKTEELRHNGEPYTINPWRLTWADENYYLIGYDDEEGKVKYYRVDKMKKVQILLEERQGSEYMGDFDFANLHKQTFGMFAGEEEVVTLRMGENMAGVVVDRFGKNITIRPLEGGGFETRVKVAVSNQFFGWITGLGTDAQIIGPISVKDKYRDYLMNLVRHYM